MGRKFEPIDINVKEQLARPYRLLIDKKEIENDVKKQLMATTHIISLDPTEINLTLSKRIEKQLPVVFEDEIKTQPGFKLSGAVQIHPEQITAYASQQILDTLSVVHTVSTSIQKANKRITQTLQIQPIEGVTFDPSTVSITVPVEEFTEKVLEVPVICSDIPAHYRVRMFPASIKVSVSVPLSLFKGLSTDQFGIDIPFAELEQKTRGVIPIELTRKPGRIDKAILSTESIEFIIEQAYGS